MEREREEIGAGLLRFDEITNILNTGVPLRPKMTNVGGHNS